MTTNNKETFSNKSSEQTSKNVKDNEIKPGDQIIGANLTIPPDALKSQGDPEVVFEIGIPGMPEKTIELEPGVEIIIQDKVPSKKLVITKQRLTLKLPKNDSELPKLEAKN